MKRIPTKLTFASRSLLVIVTLTTLCVVPVATTVKGDEDDVIDHLNPRFLNSKRKIDKETSVIFCAVGTEFSSFIHLL